MKSLAAGLALVILALSAAPVHAGGGMIQLPIISVTPTSVDFGNVPVYALAQATITVKNESADSPLVVNAVKTKAPFGDSATSFTLQPGQTKVITLAFAPQATGSYSSVCTIQSNANNARVLHVPLSGTGI